jgi:cell fate (sporulation/competence/biofilm development) regulator YlbF (YheA/YmcA/DUF963 family)
MGILNGNSIVEKAKSFAKILALSQEFQEFHSAQGKLKQDKEAQSLLEQFQKKQQEVQQARLRGKGFSGDAIYEIQELQRKLQSNSTIMELVGRQQDVISLIQEINQVISIAAGFDFGQSSSSSGPC